MVHRSYKAHKGLKMAAAPCMFLGLMNNGVVKKKNNCDYQQL